MNMLRIPIKTATDSNPKSARVSSRKTTTTHSDMIAPERNEVFSSGELTQSTLKGYSAINCIMATKLRGTCTPETV